MCTESYVAHTWRALDVNQPSIELRIDLRSKRKTKNWEIFWRAESGQLLLISPQTTQPRGTRSRMSRAYRHNCERHSFPHGPCIACRCHCIVIDTRAISIASPYIPAFRLNPTPLRTAANLPLHSPSTRSLRRSAFLLRGRAYSATAMAVDLTPSFHVALYMLFLESMLFFAVIMQTKSVEPGTHTGVARCFGMVFLFQALSALFLVLSEQFFEGYVSLYFAIVTLVCLSIAVFFCIPAAAAVAIPENNHCFRAAALITSTIIVLITTFVLSPRLGAAPDIPYINLLLRHEIFGAIIGALIILSIAATFRMIRQLKGRNGAFILLAGLALITSFGLLWAHLEPLCQQTKPNEPWPPSCPMPAAFDHNFMIAALILVANVLAAEGVLRLMAAGTGVEGYVEIVPVIHT